MIIFSLARRWDTRDHGYADMLYSTTITTNRIMENMNFGRLSNE